MNKPSVFVGSSSEGREFAQTIQVLLDEVADVTVWNQGVFGLGQTTVESLEGALTRFDFAILILAPDDLVVSRGVEYNSVRDNILIEVGLFIGRLGRERTFLVCAKSDSLKIPTDLIGINVTNFSTSKHADDALAALGPACTHIARAMKAVGRREPHDSADHHTAGFGLLRGPHQTIDAVIDALTSKPLANAVVYRVLPAELTDEIMGSHHDHVARYSELVKTVVSGGTHDIGFWDKTIYGRSLNQKINKSTVEFVKRTFVPCPSTSCIGVDGAYNHIGFFMVGETPSGFPSDFLWHKGIIFFADPESQYATPISGLMTTNHTFIESVLHKWWKVLETGCTHRGQYWNASAYVDQPEQWQQVIEEVCASINGT